MSESGGGASPEGAPVLPVGAAQSCASQACGEKAPSADADVTPPRAPPPPGHGESAQQLQVLLCLVGLSHVMAT